MIVSFQESKKEENHKTYKNWLYKIGSLRRDESAAKDLKRWDIVFISVTSNAAETLISHDAWCSEEMCVLLQHGSRPQRRSGPEVMHSRRRGFAGSSFSTCASAPLEHCVPCFFMNFSLHTARRFSTIVFSALFHEFFIHTANRCSHLRKTRPGDGWASCSGGTGGKLCPCKWWRVFSVSALKRRKTSFKSEHCRCFQTDCLLSSCEGAVCHVYLLPATCALIIYTDKQYGFYKIVMGIQFLTTPHSLEYTYQPCIYVCFANL